MSFCTWFLSGVHGRGFKVVPSHIRREMVRLIIGLFSAFQGRGIVEMKGSLFPGKGFACTDALGHGNRSVFVLISTGVVFFQLLGGAAGGTAKPTEEEDVQCGGEYIPEEGDAVGYFVAGIFFEREDVGPADAAFPGERQREVQDEGEKPGAKAEADDWPAPFSVEEHQSGDCNGEEDADEEEQNGDRSKPCPEGCHVLDAFFTQVGFPFLLGVDVFGRLVALFFLNFCLGGEMLGRCGCFGPGVFCPDRDGLFRFSGFVFLFVDGCG